MIKLGHILENLPVKLKDLESTIDINDTDLDKVFADQHGLEDGSGSPSPMAGVESDTLLTDFNPDDDVSTGYQVVGQTPDETKDDSDTVSAGLPEPSKSSADDEDPLEEGTRCWKGYEKKGMKTLFGKRVPNCVKKEEISLDEIIDIVSEETGLAAPYGSGYEEVVEDLRKWVKQRWVDISRKKKGGGHPACGASAGKKSRAGGKRAYPKCVPASKAASMSKKDKSSATRRKRAVYKGKKGKPPKKAKNVKTKVESFLKERFIRFMQELNEAAKRDKCYYKVKSRYDVWPSAYGSLSLSKCRKVGAANWGKTTSKGKKK